RRSVGTDEPRLRADSSFLRPVSALDAGFAADRCGLFGIHPRFGVPALAGSGRTMERAQAGPSGKAMTFAVDIDASKTEHGENFPVASLLITPRLRAAVLSFYRFARAADDVADHPTLRESDKF